MVKIDIATILNSVAEWSPVCERVRLLVSMYFFH